MNKINIFYSALFLVVGILLPEASIAASCTPGTDCYCDCVRNTTGQYKNATCQSRGIIGDATALLMCEDFEAPTLRQNTGLGNGAPYYGPPYDPGTQTSPYNRGGNGYWARTYANGVNAALWESGQPASPTFGSPCGFGACTGLKIWSVGDLWGANNYSPLAAFLTDGQYTAEPNLTAPAGRAGGGSGSFDGAASLFSRVPAGGTAGIYGNKTWTRVQTFGITGAVAYASNLATSGLMGSNWKGDEWQQSQADAGGDGLFLFGNPPFGERFPFYGFTFSNGATQSSCNALLAAATKTTGDFSCDAGGNFIFEANAQQYRRSRDWPLGAWGCVRGHFQNMGSTSSAIRIWFTGPSGVEVKIIDISNLNLTTHLAGRSPAGYVGFVWNNYANVNQGNPVSPSTQASGRYQDNYHIRAGLPVPCNQIGYAGSIPAPANLRVQ